MNPDDIPAHFRPAREQLIRIATDRNAWPYQEQIEALLDTIEREIREQVAREIEAVANSGMWGSPRTAGLEMAISIARGNTTEETSR
ncbi:hypothetical protein [Kitasatospora cineracea]|uniref:hypothetical protein n=1 Tax=Kitasatospora cineracea TaxID=88074 RepID=UPI0036CE9A23